jgi:hypothetical protein
MAETLALSFLAPTARPLAPQVTALPPLAAYHDLRWLFAFNQSWLGFTGVLVLLVLARSAADAVLVQLAWPRANARDVPAVPKPRFLTSIVSCAVLTVLVALVMSPVVTLMFGVALLPFSWPYLAAVPILLGTAVALSQGGVGQTWWRRLPPARTAAWVIATFLVLSLASALMAHLDTPATVAVAGLAGVIDARAWYGLTAAAAMRSEARGAEGVWPGGVGGMGLSQGGSGGMVPPGRNGGGFRGVVPPGQQGPLGLALRAALQRIRWALRDRTSWVPVAPLAAVLVLALVVGLTRLAFTGTVRFTGGTSDPAAAAVAADTDDGATGQRSGGPATTGTRPHGALLVVGGFGSSCCHVADTLRAAEPGLIVRQFSYLGLDASGRPVPYGPAAGNLPIQVLGDRMATQVEKLYQQTRTPVDVVAESEGTLGLYAMLARHPHVPVRSLILLSPIVEPGQVDQAGLGAGTVPGAALKTLNNLVGGMSPYGSSGAQELIDSVGEVGASYFAMVSHDRGLPWLAVVPLADAVTLPACPWPQNMIFVDAFHGGLLGDASVRQMIVTFLASGSVRAGSASQRHLRTAAQLIAAAATAWRMPQLHPACPGA